MNTHSTISQTKLITIKKLIYTKFLTILFINQILTQNKHISCFYYLILNFRSITTYLSTNFTINNQNNLKVNYNLYFLQYYNLFKKNINLDAIQAKLQIFSLLEIFIVTYLLKKSSYKTTIVPQNYYKTLNKLYLKTKLLFEFKKRIRRFYIFKRYKINKKKTFYTLFALFVFKDLKLLKSWVERVYRKLKIKIHRIFFRAIKLLIRLVFTPYFKELNILGISMSMKGKISATGASKKKKLSFRFGRTSNTLQNQRVLSEQLNIKTNSGNLGVVMFLYY